MTRTTWYTALFLIAIAAAAGAADFGGHVGYFGNDVQKADVGVNVMIPLGMVALFPNIDYTKQEDRKSTRLNSSHLVISYAVFCLKKKRRTRVRPVPAWCT